MSDLDAKRIEQAILFIDEHFKHQPSLEEIADHVGLSEYHFQRLFKRWAGISPKRFLQFLTAEYARGLLAQSRSVLDAALDAGLSGPSRLHDLTINVHAATPGEIGQKGAGLEIHYGVHPSPFGACLLARNERGVCWLSFHPCTENPMICSDTAVHGTGASTVDKAIHDLQKDWQNARIIEDAGVTESVAEKIFNPSAKKDTRILPLHVKGTNFQIRVWEALLRIPAGQLVSYGDVANLVENPGATRAVASAVGRNPVSFLIPCHRVIRSTGAFGKYRWGPATKKAIIGWEAAHLKRDRMDATS